MSYILIGLELKTRFKWNMLFSRFLFNLDLRIVVELYIILLDSVIMFYFVVLSSPMINCWYFNFLKFSETFVTQCFSIVHRPQLRLFGSICCKKEKKVHVCEQQLWVPGSGTIYLDILDFLVMHMEFSIIVLSS